MSRRRNTQMWHTMMILVFFFLSRAGCDWVEISQNHYRKEPLRPVAINSNVEESTKANTAYRNHSILEKHWKKGVVDRVQSVPNIRRVHAPSVKISSIQNDESILNTEATQERSNVYVSAKPNSLSKYHEEELPMKSSKSTEVLHQTSESTFDRNLGDSTIHQVYIDKTSTINRIESAGTRYITKINTGNVNTDFDEENSNFQRITNIQSVKTTYLDKAAPSTADTHTTHYQESIVNENQKKTVTENLLSIDPKIKQFTKTINNPSLQKTNPFIKLKKPMITGYEVTQGHSHLNNLKISNKIDKNEENIQNPNDKLEETKLAPEKISDKTKGNTIDAMWKIIKVVTDAISKSTKKGFKSKINYLEDLKTKILSSIEDQVERTWPDDDTRTARRARDTGRDTGRNTGRDTGRGHVEFPSSESALMSISFLTFAVFLIKLVLQVIHTYKNKTMMVTPAVLTAVGRAAAALKYKTPE